MTDILINLAESDEKDATKISLRIKVLNIYLFSRCNEKSPKISVNMQNIIYTIGLSNIIYN